MSFNCKICGTLNSGNKHCEHSREVFVDIHTASHAQMEKAFALHREQIVDLCHQLHMDVAHYNEYRKPPAPIEIVFDFRDDVAEREVLRVIEWEEKQKQAKP